MLLALLLACVLLACLPVGLAVVVLCVVCVMCVVCGVW